MTFKSLDQILALGDDEFNELYPAAIRALAAEHWTPVEVAKRAAEYLAPTPGTRVLDIGSGAGKFCIVGAACTEGQFTGVEQRGHLVEVSKSVATTFELSNAQFIKANITDVAFANFNSFYFFNSFHENRSLVNKIDESVDTSPSHFAKYSAYVTRELSKAPPRTRLVTYWTCLWDVPAHFQRVRSEFDGLLDFWEKTA